MNGEGMIHPTALISPGAKLGSNVSVGPFSIIHDGVTIGNETSIGSHCEIGLFTDLASKKTLVMHPTQTAIGDLNASMIF